MQWMKKISWVASTVASTLALALVLAACGDAGGGASEGAAEGSAGASSGGEGASSEAACGFAGTWTGPFAGGALAGTTITWRFQEDGTAHTEFGEVAFDSDWEAEGDLIWVTDTTPTTCTGVRGSFRIAYEGGCDQVQVSTAEDPCEQRRSSIDGMTLRRQ